MSDEAGATADSAAPQSFRALLRVVLRQSFWICCGYLLLGILSELLRLGDLKAGDNLQNFLDGLPITFLRLTGFIDLYVEQTVLGALTPFWNRCLLAALTVALIFVQTMLLGTIFSIFLLWLERRLTRSAPADR
ncbi:MAG: hypothetical protein IKC51_06690 [Myxococcaceae bacterium]|nr:hypothetical protein [Myxococcaceae bacterium]